jgi:molecular chaperone GrpE
MNQESQSGSDASTEPTVNVPNKGFWAGKDKSTDATEAEEPTSETAADTAEAQGEGDDAEPQKPAYVLELEQKLAHTEKTLSEKDLRLAATLQQYKEALDEFENAKTRLRRDIGKEIEAGKRSILGELLDVVDNLERAVCSSEAAKDNAEMASLLGGVSMVRDQFLAKLQGLGVTRFKAHGALFDPSRCEAVSIVPVPDAAQDGIVVGVIRDCYLMGSDTLRHGMVAVGKGPDVEDTTGAEQDQQPE